MAYTLSTLQADVFARGFDPFNDGGTKLAMVTRFINDANHWVEAQEPWPFRQATTTGVTPLTIADLGTIDAVVDTAADVPLEPVDRRWLRNNVADLTTTGSALVYYVTGGNIINLYPVQGSLTITVDYYKISPDLSAPGDAPLMPDRYRASIVEYTCERLHRVRREPDLAAACRAAGDLIVAQMTQDLMLSQYQGTQDFFEPVGEDC